MVGAGLVWYDNFPSLMNASHICIALLVTVSQSRRQGGPVPIFARNAAMKVLGRYMYLLTQIISCIRSDGQLGWLLAAREA